MELAHAAVKQLPTDIDLTGLCTVEQIIFDDQRDFEPSANDENPNDICIFVPIAARKITEQESINNSILKRLSSTCKETVPCLSQNE